MTSGSSRPPRIVLDDWILCALNTFRPAPEPSVTSVSRRGFGVGKKTKPGWTRSGLFKCLNAGLLNHNSPSFRLYVRDTRSFIGHRGKLGEFGLVY